MHLLTLVSAVNDSYWLGLKELSLLCKSQLKASICVKGMASI